MNNKDLLKEICLDIHAGGVLIYSFNKDGKIVFLLGRENYVKSIQNNKHSKAGKLCDFGGGILNTESIQYGITREFYEESMGAIMSNDDLLKLITSDEAFIFINKEHPYIECIIKINYNTELPRVYNNIRRYLDACMLYISKDDVNFLHTIPSCPHGYLEKTEIKWLTISDILNDVDNIRMEFRNTIYKVIKIYFTHFLSPEEEASLPKLIDA
jgi:hypothetical protein